MIEHRISENSSSKKIFEENVKEYEEALLRSGYNKKLEYKQNGQNMPTKDRSDEKKKKKIRKRKIHRFNPPFNNSVETNVGKQFLKLVDKYFGQERKDKLHKIFNRQTLKISYSCTQNFGNVIKNHNKTIMQNEMEEEGVDNRKERKCNCRKKEECPLQGECVIESVVYKARVKEESSGEEVSYIGSTEGPFKQRLYGHRTDLKCERNRNNTMLAQYMWKMKEKGENVSVKWEIIKRCNKYKSGSKRCDVCLSEKLEILKGRKKGEKLLNRRNELMNKCRHKRKFILEP